MSRSFIVVLCLLCFEVINAQTDLSGRITDENDAAVVGATVRIVNTLKGTSTNSEGDFSLKNVPGNPIIIEFSSIGYRKIIDTIALEDNDFELQVKMETEIYLADAFIVEATRASDNSPMTFSTMKKQEIIEMNTGRDIPYILNQTTSMVSTSDAGAGVGYTYLRMRGMDQSNINVTINGIALNDPESHLVFYVNLPDFASSLSDIQIQRGVGTSTNGAGAFGGSINMQTESLNEKPYGEISFGAGSFNTKKTSIKVGSGVFNKYWSVDGRYSSIQSKGYIDRATSDLQSYFLSGGYNNGKTSVKLLVFGGAEETYQAWYGIDSATLETDRRTNFAGAIYDTLGNVIDYYENEVDHYNQDHIQLHMNHSFSDKLRLQLAGHYTFGRGYFEQFKQSAELSQYGIDPVMTGSDTILYADMVVRPWLNNHYYGLIYNFNYSTKTWNIDFGGAANNYDGDHFGEIIWASYNGNTKPNVEYYRNKGEKFDFNEYVKVTKKFGKKTILFVDLQYRFINYSISGTDDSFGDLDLKRSYGFFNPKIGVTYQTTKYSDVYFSSSIAHREPSRNDLLYSTNYGAVEEKLYDQELGFRWSKGGDAVAVNAYYMYYENQLVPTGQINDVGEQIRTNSGKSYRAGVELSVLVHIFSKLIFKPNLAFSNNENLDYHVQNEVGGFNAAKTPIAYSPNLVLNEELQYQPFKFLTVSWYSRLVGTQYLDNSGKENAKLDPYGVMDFRIEYHSQYKWVKKLSIFANAFNILNNKYVSNGYMWGTTPYYFPQAEINFLVGATIRF